MTWSTSVFNWSELMDISERCIDWIILSFDCAKCNGVRPELSKEFMSVPALKSRVITSILLVQTAKWRAVFPMASFWLGFAPLSNRSRAKNNQNIRSDLNYFECLPICVFPLQAAKWSAVRLRSSHDCGSIPSLSNFSTVSKSSELEALLNSLSPVLKIYWK